MAEDQKTLRLVGSDGLVGSVGSVGSDSAALTAPLPKALAGQQTTATLESADTMMSGPIVSSEPGAVTDVEAEIATGDPSRRYEHKSLLGEGGMGEVRLCRDKHISRDVAMKVMRPSAEQRNDLRARFLREARVQGQLEHPAIVPVYDLGRDSAGNAYFTMRRIKGQTLEEIIESLRAGGKEVGDYARHKLLSAFLRVCLAVDYAHKKGVIHRDLKPGNIMLGAYGEVYVLDWGLAKLLTPQEQATLEQDEQVRVSSSGVNATDVGQVMGTPGYMAPEQILGQTAEVGPRADIYALGAILFELLALEPLCGTGSATEVLMRAVKGLDASPQSRAPHRHVPPELDTVCVRSTMAVPRERFATAREMHDEIDRYLAGDRDFARRRELAVEHTARAHVAAQGATESEEQRKAALLDVGRALALDPTHAPAIAVLVDMLTHPPKTTPKDVTDKIHATERESRRSGMLVGAGLFFFGSIATWVPFALAMGVRNWPIAIATDVAWTLVAAACLFFYYRPADTKLPVVSALAAVATGMTSMLFGPLIVVPAVAAAGTVCYVISGQREHRKLAVAAGILSILVPYALELVGVLPPSIRVEGGVVTVLPRVFAFHPVWTPVFLVVSQVSVIVISSIFVRRYREAFLRAEERMHLAAWQLRQLVPEAAKGAFDSSVPEPNLCAADLVQRALKKTTGA
jgi:serine/threonine-protein kinase